MHIHKIFFLNFIYRVDGTIPHNDQKPNCAKGKTSPPCFPAFVPTLITVAAERSKNSIWLGHLFTDTSYFYLISQRSYSKPNALQVKNTFSHHSHQAKKNFFSFLLLPPKSMEHFHFAFSSPRDYPFLPETALHQLIIPSDPVKFFSYTVLTTNIRSTSYKHSRCSSFWPYNILPSATTLFHWNHASLRNSIYGYPFTLSWFRVAPSGKKINHFLIAKYNSLYSLQDLFVLSLCHICPC